MLRLGSFYDNQTEADYDLYQVSAKVVKDWLDKSFPMTQLKLNLFNKSTGAKSDIDSAVAKSNGALEFDYDQGIILNKDDYRKEHEEDYYRDRLLEDSGRIVVDSDDNQRHLLGYELMPLAISVKDKNLIGFDKVYLLDGFRRMYYTPEVPDIPVFVKVYDLLSPAQWSNAMLLYNSWKLVQSEKFDLFVDRGFKFGLYTHFGIDVTLANERALDLFESYLGRDFYVRLKGNCVLPEDIKTSLELYDKYVGKGRIGYLSPSDCKMSYVFKELYSNLGKIRTFEYRNNSQADARLITPEMVEELFSRPEIAKHLKKVESMQVGGYIENYVEKHLRLPLVNMLRRLYDVEELSDKYIEFFSKFAKHSVLTPNSVYDERLAEKAERAARLKAERVCL